MRPDIAQAIHDAAVSWPLEFLGDIESQIVARVFASWFEWWDTNFSHKDGFHGWLRTTEGRTYMLFVAEALS